MKKVQKKFLGHFYIWKHRSYPITVITHVNMLNLVQPLKSMSRVAFVFRREGRPLVPDGQSMARRFPSTFLFVLCPPPWPKAHGEQEALQPQVHAHTLQLLPGRLQYVALLEGE